MKLSILLDIRSKSDGSSTTSFHSEDLLLEAEEKQSQCLICFDYAPDQFLYGLSPYFQKNCKCNTQTCVPCLRADARFKIRAGLRPACPGRLDDSRICPRFLDQNLLALLFRKECPLCDSQIDEILNPILTSGCALNHNFCRNCLKDNILSYMRSHHRLPQCPRAGECHFVYDEDAIRDIFSDMTDTIEDLLIDWHNLRLHLIQDEHPLLKNCVTPNCSGFLSVSKAVDKSGSSKFSFPSLIFTTSGYNKTWSI